MIGRLLKDEAYTGTLICHKSERNKINKTFRFTEAAEQFRHENYLPPIITREMWEQVQELMNMRKKDNVRAGEGQTIHRYSGLIACGDCGRTFIGKRIKLKNGQRVEYVCSTHHRFGEEHCSAHTLREEYLDEIIRAELIATKAQYQQMWDAMQDTVNRWTYQSVKNILAEESYTGLLVNHRTETHGRTVTPAPEDEQYRHENFFTVIIDREEWEQVQALLKANAKPYRGNTPSHRYARLLTCGDCGSTFVPRIRCWNRRSMTCCWRRSKAKARSF